VVAKMSKNTIAVDAMGGDLAPASAIEGAIAAIAENPDISIMLVGNVDKISGILDSHSYDKNRIQIIHAATIIENDDSPTIAIKTKKDSSIVVGLNLVKTKDAQAFVSAGSTGAILAGATLILKRVSGVSRPALATLLPSLSGYTFLVDSGANMDCKPEYLVQFAQMGSVYMREIMGIANPKVGLVNVGTEEGKGNELAKAAYDLLKSANINFVGNIEGRNIPLGEVDVAVCDGFVGNVTLKFAEGFAKGMMTMLKQELMSSNVSKIGAALSKGAYGRLRKRFDYTEVGGAPFIGLNALVVKAHGSSNAKAMKNAINQCTSFIKTDIAKKIEETIT
jgi:glycerol-3-phosphate acyltransferase PlsX